jgi:pantoate--beta-alanine ligase
MAYPCPCCGYKTLTEVASGTYDICPVCFWEDDPVQLDDPDFAGGANRPSLREAQRIFDRIGAIEPRLKEDVRAPLPTEARDANWTPLRSEMRVLASVDDVRHARSVFSHATVGLVPTMGFLHEGHLSLVREARAKNDYVFVSIFVNPTQFGPNEDLSTYPRDMERDLALLRTEGVDYVFAPSPEEMYPDGFGTSVDVGDVALPLEGQARPGHFKGVATVVLKLFNVVQPTRAYFGRKDAQQLVVIRRMVRDLDVPVEIVAMPTVREPDGLAMSSRNAYLDPEQREAALVLHQALELAREMWTRGTRDTYQYEKRLAEVIEDEPLARLEYVAVVDPETLRDLERIQGRALVLVAARLGKTRLIDNVMLGE